jgi:hypothetical protein
VPLCMQGLMFCSLFIKQRGIHDYQVEALKEKGISVCLRDHTTQVLISRESRTLLFYSFSSFNFLDICSVDFVLFR